MVTKADFTDILTQFRALPKSDVNEAYGIFGLGGKDTVISNEVLSSGSYVRNYLVLSEPMQRFVRDVKESVRQLLQFPENDVKISVYYARYGGSKTQFTALLKDELLHAQDEDRDFPSNHLVFLDFPKLSKINGNNIFDQISAGIIKNVASITQNDREYKETFSQLLQRISEIQVGIAGNNKKREINNKLDIILKKSGQNIQNEINQIKNDLDYIQFMNDEIIIKKIKEIVSSVSKYNFIFVWLLDEIDQWFDIDTGIISDNFRNLSRVFHEIFEFGTICKTQFLFTATSRCRSLLEDRERVYILEQSNAAISRFILLYRQANTINEDGFYGDSIYRAILNLTAMKCVIEGLNIVNDLFIKFLNQFNDYFSQNEYKQAPRRNVNGSILAVLREFFKIKNEVEKGIQDLEESKWIQLGNAIPQILPTIIRKLGITTPFERKELKQNEKYLDGEFKISKSGNADISVEIKLCQDIKSLRTDQLSDAVKTSNKWIIFLVFGDVEKNAINREILRDFTKENILDKANLIKPIIVSNRLAFAPMIGTREMNIQSMEKAEEIYQACANFLKYFSSFTIDLNAIFIEHKRAFPQEYEIETSISMIKETDKTTIEEQSSTIKQVSNLHPIPEDEIKEPIDILVLETLLLMKKENAFTKGKKTINAIKKALKNSPGLLTNIDKIEIRLLDKKILKNTDSSSWQFVPKVAEKGYDSEVKIEEFRQFIINEFLKN